MTNQAKFFNCYSKNLNEYLKAVGLRYMSKQVHTKGISVNKDGKWGSYSSLKAASEQENISFGRLLEAHDTVNSATSQGNYLDENGVEYAKRSRDYWTYLISPELEKALAVWKKTGPKSEV